MRKLLNLAALLLTLIGPARADFSADAPYLDATIAGVRTATFASSLTAGERQANANALQYAIDQAEASAHKTLKRPAGLIPVDMTTARRFIQLDRDLKIIGDGPTIIQLGPDSQGGPGWDSPNYNWSIFRVAPTSCRIEIGEGLTLQAPDVDPARYAQGPAGPVDNTPPSAFFIEGANKPNIRRTVVWKNPRIRGPWCDGIVVGGDNGLHLDPPPSGIRTAIWLTDADIETAGNGIAAFGTDKLVRIRGLRAVCGTYYRNPDGSYKGGFGNSVYVHQGVELHLTDFDVTTAHGRDAIKYAGTGSSGSAAYSVIANGIVRSGRPGTGTGLGYDKWMPHGIISGVTFDASLRIGIQHWGSVSTSQCVFRSQFAYGGAGDLSGEANPIISSTHDRFFSQFVFSTVIENGEINFDHPVWQPATPGGTFLAIPRGNAKAQTMRGRIEYLRAIGPCRSVVEIGGGSWELIGLDSTSTPTHGVFGFGIPESASLTVRGGRWPVESAWYHSALAEDKARVQFGD